MVWKGHHCLTIAIKATSVCFCEIEKAGKRAGKIEKKRNSRGCSRASYLWLGTVGKKGCCNRKE